LFRETTPASDQWERLDPARNIAKALFERLEAKVLLGKNWFSRNKPRFERWRSNMAVKATLNIPEPTGRDGAIDHIVKLQDGSSARGPGTVLHSGSRGDWYLVKDEGGVCVIHIPDLAKGQSARRMSVVDVLMAGGPEREELIRLIGTLVKE
jgi:hypothetical protein